LSCNAASEGVGCGLRSCEQEQGAAALAERVVREPLPFLVRAGEILAGSLDYEQTLHRLLDIVVPALADMCSVHLLDEDGRFRRIAARHHTAEAAALSAGLTDQYMDFGERDGPIHRLLASATSILSSPVTDADLDLIVGPVRRAEIVRHLGVTSAMVVPLVARGRPFGVLCMSTAVRPTFELAHLHLAEEIGRRGALALDSARLYQDARVLNERLAEQLGLSDAVVRNIAEGIMVTDCDWRITYVNPVAEQILGRSRDDLIGKNAHEVAHVRDETGTPFTERECRVREVLLTGRTVRLDDEVFIRADGETFPVDISSSPLTKDGRVVGAVTIFRDVSDRKQAELDRSRLERALRRLVHQLMGAQEDERRRLAYEIHDGVAQMASGVQQLVEAYAHDFPGATEAARNRMDVTIGLARRTVSEIRRVLAGLRPTVLDDFGLARGLRAYAEGLAGENLNVAFSESVGAQRLDSEVEIALFRLAQEALTNVRKHARVREATLRLRREDDRIVVEVEDGGSGFDLASLRECDRPGERLGLFGMRERIAQVGGSVEIRSRRGEGTLVRAVVPVAGLAAGRGGTEGE
jgi:PAS domain S-box-containing protein